MLAEKGYFLSRHSEIRKPERGCRSTDQDEKSFKDVEELPSAVLVAGFYALTNNVDHRRKQTLEGFLRSRLILGITSKRHSTYDFLLVVCVDVLSDDTKGPVL